MTDTITTPQMLQAWETMCETIENEKEYLSELDGAIDDGDHGVNMAKYFREVKKNLAAAVADFEHAAKQGMESTKEMLAEMGRANRLGERTIGHQNAGATSCYFILRSFVSAISCR